MLTHIDNSSSLMCDVEEAVRQHRFQALSVLIVSLQFSSLIYISVLKVKIQTWVFLLPINTWYIFEMNCFHAFRHSLFPNEPKFLSTTKNSPSNSRHIPKQVIVHLDFWQDISHPPFWKMKSWSPPTKPSSFQQSNVFLLVAYAKSLAIRLKFLTKPIFNLLKTPP